MVSSQMAQDLSSKLVIDLPTSFFMKRSSSSKPHGASLVCTAHGQRTIDGLVGELKQQVWKTILQGLVVWG
jgi:hypothetical protein